MSTKTRSRRRRRQRREASKKGLNLALYKTELCKTFEATGTCKHADKCAFAHGKRELRERKRVEAFKALPCPDPALHRFQRCAYGERCNFAHPGEALRCVFRSAVESDDGSPPRSSDPPPGFAALSLNDDVDTGSSGASGGSGESRSRSRSGGSSSGGGGGGGEQHFYRDSEYHEFLGAHPVHGGKHYPFGIYV